MRNQQLASEDDDDDESDEEESAADPSITSAEAFDALEITLRWLESQNTDADHLLLVKKWRDHAARPVAETIHHYSALPWMLSMMTIGCTCNHALARYCIIRLNEKCSLDIHVQYSGVNSRVAGVVSSSGFSRKQTVKRTSTVIINRLQKAGYEHNSGVIIYEHNALYCENTEVQLSSIIVKWTKKLNG